MNLKYPCSIIIIPVNMPRQNILLNDRNKLSETWNNSHDLYVDGPMSCHVMSCQTGLVVNLKENLKEVQRSSIKC